MDYKLPKGWVLKKLGDIGKISAGGTPRRGKMEYWTNGTIPWVKISDMTGKYITSTSEKINQLGLENSSAKIFSKGTILISIFATLGDVGILKIDAACNQAIASIQLNDSKIYPDFLYYYLKTLKKHFENIGRGVAQNNINQTILKNIEIPLPPLETQKKIVAIIEKAEELKTLRIQINEFTNQLIQSIFLEMFGDPAKNRKRFSIIELSSLYSNEKAGVKCGPFGSALKKFEYTDKGIPVWTMENIQGTCFIDEIYLYISLEKYQELKNYSVENDDILISRAGTVGKMCVINSTHFPSIFSSNLICLSLNKLKINPIYFVYLMALFGEKVGRLKTGNDDTYTFMNTHVLNRLKIPNPPIDMQDQFAMAVEHIQDINKLYLKSSNNINILYNTLIEKAFNGELIT